MAGNSNEGVEGNDVEEFFGHKR